MIFVGLLIIAFGALCQSSSYVPINKIKDWSWESYWLVQGVFAWLVLPLLGALLAVPEEGSLWQLFAADPTSTALTIFYGVLWGVGGLTFGLSMRYLGVALGQSIALGTCAGLGTILAPVFTGQASSITVAVVVGVVVTLIGIAIIGIAGSMKARQLKGGADTVKEFNFTRGISVALLAGLMSACFNIGLYQGSEICFAGVNPMYATLPATFLVTLGGFLTNACYCLWQNGHNDTFGDYRHKSVWLGNLALCLLAGALWYSQFFGLALGKGFLTEAPTLFTIAFCILMALNVVFSNLWGIILHEWRGCSPRTITVLVVGIAVLILSCFLPQLI